MTDLAALTARAEQWKAFAEECAVSVFAPDTPNEAQLLTLAYVFASVEDQVIGRVAADPSSYKGFKARIIRQAHGDLLAEIEQLSQASDKIDPKDANGVPITLERIWTELIKAKRYDLAVQMAIGLYERQKYDHPRP